MDTPNKKNNFQSDGSRSTPQQRSWHKRNNAGKKLQAEIASSYKKPKGKCVECGSPTMHKKTCTRRPGGAAIKRDVRAPLPVPITADELLSEFDFDVVHEDFSTLQESRSVAAKTGLPLAAVNEAMRFRTYEDYLQDRDV